MASNNLRNECSLKNVKDSQLGTEYAIPLFVIDISTKIILKLCILYA